jgi:hypothetical protein
MEPRFTIVSRLKLLDQPMVLGHAQGAQEALRLAQKFVAQGMNEVVIGDNQVQKLFAPTEFSAQYNVR